MYSHYQNFNANVEYFNNHDEELKNIEPQKLINLIGKDKIAIVNSLSDYEFIASSTSGLKNNFGKNFVNTNNIYNYDIIIVYCANYTCSAGEKYIKKLKEKFPNYSGKIIDYKGGIFEWAKLSIIYNEFQMLNFLTKKPFEGIDLVDIMNKFKHRIKKTNIEKLDNAKISNRFSVTNYRKGKLLNNKVCVVTGATAGLGLEVVKYMLNNGAKHVTGTFFNNDVRASKIYNELVNTYGNNKVLILKADARTKLGNQQTFHQDYRQKLVNDKILPEDCVGVDCVDINAGIFGPASYNRKHIHQIDIDKYDEVMNLNLRGYVLGVQQFIKQAIHHKIKNASIVCIKSIYGSGGSRFSNPAYQISKHGTMGLVRQTAIEFARPSVELQIPHKIRINAVSPTFTTTALTEEMLSYDQINNTIAKSNPTGNLADKKSIASAVCWLLSDEATDITGIDLPVDCGVLSEVIPTVSEVNELNFDKNIELLSCCGATN